MKRTLLLLVAMGIALAGSVSVAATRGPIVILGDADFTAANGVVGGSGTDADPYVIAGHEVAAAAGDAYAVRIENVTAAFALRGLVIQGASLSGGAALRIAHASRGVVDGCTISASLNGVEIISSTAITLRSTVLAISGFGLRVSGDRAEQYDHDIDASNVLNGRKILYYYGIDGETVSGTTSGHLTIAGSRNVTVTGNDVVNGDGIFLAFVTDSTVTANEVFRTTPVITEHGLFLYRSTGNVVAENALRNSRLAGIQLTLSSQNEVRENQILANDSGIRLVASDENRLVSNVLFANVSGIVLSGGSDANEIDSNILYHENTKQGITLEAASGNRVVRNGLQNCEVGITLGPDAVENVVLENTILRGAYGISLYGSLNRIERNLIAQQARGVLAAETFGRTTTRGNRLLDNVFTDNNHHIYLNLDSDVNVLGGNAFLGASSALVADKGPTNVWTSDGVGNYWGGVSIVDADGDGRGDLPVTVYPSGALDVAPLARFTPETSGLGILSGLTSSAVSIVRSDGSGFELTVMVADDGIERWAGFRGFPKDYVTRYPGILFEFADESYRSFTMSTVLFDLDIAFFDGEGNFVSSTRMTADADESFAATGPFQYALELTSGSLDMLRIGEGARLVLP